MILICGAGIAGLTLANILEQLGEDYLVIEKAPRIRAEGAGIVLHHNALCILEALRLADDLPGVWLSSMQIHSGRSKKTLDFSPHSAPRALAVHREELMQRLLSQIPVERICCNAQVESLQCRGDSVLVKNTLADKHGRMVVVANGASSHLHGTPQFRSSGQWCWRAIVPSKDLKNVGAEHWFGRHRVGVIPIAADRAYVFHVMQDANENDREERRAWLREQQTLGGFGALDFEGAEWLSHPLDERVIDWGSGNRVAIGDAAHAMTPNMGLGAALAMEDAWSLAELIQQGDTSTPYSVQLAAKRHKRVQSIQRQSWQIGNMAHLPQGPLRTLRNTVLKLTPRRVMSRQQRRLMLAYTAKMKALVA